MRRLIVSLVIVFILLLGGKAQNVTERPYVLIVSFDGFRWDYLDRGLTPHLQKMIDQGVRAITFEPAFPSKTFPNHYTIVTGLYPEHHGLINNTFFDPFKNKRYRLGDTSIVRDAYWYKGEALWETAERQGVLSASFFWPGSEVHLHYRHPSYFKKYDGSIPHLKRINGIIEWLQLPPQQRPHLLFLYFSDTDTKGHLFGPNSEQVNQAIALLDRQIGLLRAKIDSIGLTEKMNLIVLSDHGMTPLRSDGQIPLYRLLKGKQVRVDGYGPLIHIFVDEQQQKENLFTLLRKNQKHFKVYKKENLPAYFHYHDSPFIGDIVAIADLGYWFVVDEKELQKRAKRTVKGDHGYDNHTLDMQGIFIATGPAFKNGYRCETLHNVDVYPLVCKILNIVPNAKIDGDINRIGFILKD